MNLFALTLEEDSYDWFVELEDGKIKTMAKFNKLFLEIWGDTKEYHHLLAALHAINVTAEIYIKLYLMILQMKTSVFDQILKNYIFS